MHARGRFTNAFSQVALWAAGGAVVSVISVGCTRGPAPQLRTSLVEAMPEGTLNTTTYLDPFACTDGPDWDWDWAGSGHYYTEDLFIAGRINALAGHEPPSKNREQTTLADRDGGGGRTTGAHVESSDLTVTYPVLAHEGTQQTWNIDEGARPSGWVRVLRQLRLDRRRNLHISLGAWELYGKLRVRVKLSRLTFRIGAFLGTRIYF